MLCFMGQLIIVWCASLPVVAGIERNGVVWERWFHLCVPSVCRHWFHHACSGAVATEWSSVVDGQSICILHSHHRQNVGQCLTFLLCSVCEWVLRRCVSTGAPAVGFCGCKNQGPPPPPPPPHADSPLLSPHASIDVYLLCSFNLVLFLNCLSHSSRVQVTCDVTSESDFDLCDRTSFVLGVFVIRCLLFWVFWGLDVLFWVFLWLDVCCFWDWMSCSRCFCDWMSVVLGVLGIRCLFWVFLWLDISCSGLLWLDICCGCYCDWMSFVQGVTGMYQESALVLSWPF